jgi:DNA-binding response OmpR family regulator
MGDNMKQIRDISNTDILVIESDELYTARLCKFLRKECKTILAVDCEDEALEIVKEGHIDVVIADLRLKGEDAQDVLREIKKFSSTIPIIVIDNGEDTYEDLKKAILSNAYMYFNKDVDFSQILNAVIMGLNQSNRSDKIKLKYGYYFDDYRETLFDKHNKKINLTSTELKLLKLIIDNRGDVISYEEIEEEVWRDKDMSLFTMRNVVNKIRQKSYPGIIRNVSGRGYILTQPMGN